MKLKRTLLPLLSMAMTASVATAASISDRRPVIYVNSDVTTHLIMPESLKMVDISTNLIAGDQCADNMVRLKPVASDDTTAGYSVPFMPDQFLGTITLIGERHMAQYDIRYINRPELAEALFKVQYEDGLNYSNPETGMPEGEMAGYAWAIAHTRRRFNSVRSKKHGIQASINNIYSIGNYFFVDLSLKNKTNITYDIDQIQITLTDKKEVKATNSQTLYINPAFVLNNTRSFKKDYRQVLVLDKLTFPEEKVLNIEISEGQISGRVISIPIEYEDILHADTFDGTKINAYEKEAARNTALQREIDRLSKELREKEALLVKSNSQVRELSAKLKSSRYRYIKVREQLETMQRLERELRNLDDALADFEEDIEEPGVTIPHPADIKEGIYPPIPAGNGNHYAIISED